jgi:hypothetical protein
MTAKDKAIELYNKFYGIPLYIKTVKESCNIVVDEVLFYARSHGFIGLVEYYGQVKEEINNI